MRSRAKKVCKITRAPNGILFFGVIVFVLGIKQASAADRVAFEYVDDQGGGVLVRDGKGRWLEFSNGQERFVFDEQNRSNERIELLDLSRDVALRVYSDFGEIRIREFPWRPWRRGKWIERNELPDEIRFIPSDNKIRLIYFVPSDRQPIANYEQKFRVVMEFVNEIYSRSLRDLGYDFERLNYQTDAADDPVIHLVRSNRTAQYYNNGPGFDLMKQYGLIYNDIPPDVGSVHRHTMMVLAETYDPGPAPKEWNGSVGAARHDPAGGGVAIMSAWILKDEFCGLSLAQQKEMILDATPITGRRAFGSRTPDSPRFEFIEDGFGAVSHELGHALSLSHDYRAGDNIMGHGFRHLQTNYRPSSATDSQVTFSLDNARMLRASPYLTFGSRNQEDIASNANAESANQLDKPPAADVIASWDSEGPAGINVTLNASDERGLRAVVFFSPQLGTVIGGSDLKGVHHEIKIRLSVDRKLDPFQLITTLVDTGGNFTKLSTQVTP